jgi:hypothetical protein
MSDFLKILDTAWKIESAEFVWKEMDDGFVLFWIEMPSLYDVSITLAKQPSNRWALAHINEFGMWQLEGFYGNDKGVLREFFGKEDA